MKHYSGIVDYKSISQRTTNAHNAQFSGLFLGQEPTKKTNPSRPAKPNAKLESPPL